jgi:hypothetical protein
MKVKSFDIGLESITRVGFGEDVHLPKEGPIGPTFLPQIRPLDDVLHRPSLDERLPQLLQPLSLDAELLEPSVLAAARLSARELFADAARHSAGHRRRVLDQAALFLEDDVALDEEVRTALAALLRG